MWQSQLMVPSNQDNEKETNGNVEGKTKIFQLAIETLGLVTSVVQKWIHQISESRISISIQESAIFRVRSSITTKTEEDKSLA